MKKQRAGILLAGLSLLAISLAAMAAVPAPLSSDPAQAVARPLPLPEITAVNCVGTGPSTAPCGTPSRSNPTCFVSSYPNACRPRIDFCHCSRSRRRLRAGTASIPLPQEVFAGHKTRQRA